VEVIRKKSGYRVSCTDSEFAALAFIVDLGREGASDPKNLTRLRGMAKHAMRSEQFTSPDGPLKVTDDRRSAPEEPGAEC
jgi:hypothetical protein